MVVPLLLALLGCSTATIPGERDWITDIFPREPDYYDIKRLPKVNGCRMVYSESKGFLVYSESCLEVPAYPDGYRHESLAVVATGIEKLSVGAFTTWGQITSLRVDMNTKLVAVEPRVFFSLSSLTNLSISNNYRLESLDPDVFDGLTNLRELRLVKNGVISLFDVTLATRPYILPSLLYLDLSDNHFPNIQKIDFLEMEGAPLETLRLTTCGITSIEPDSFSSLRMLKSLILDENNLMSDTLARLIFPFNETHSQIRHLSFASNVLYRNIRNLLYIISYTNITSLDISFNHFESLTADFFPFMPNLEVLIMNGVASDVIEVEAFSSSVLPNLKRLDFAKNRIKGFIVPIIIPNLVEVNVEENSCFNCAVSSYFEITDYSLQSMVNLEILRLSKNVIYLATENMFYGLQSLKALYLSNCSLVGILDNAFSQLNKLEHLDLSANTKMRTDAFNSSTFSGLDSLISLRLDGSSIISFKYPNIFSPLKSLKYLTLRDNKIYEIDPYLFLPLTNLVRLDISNNDISSWNKQSFSENKKLEIISVASNYIYSVTPEMVLDFENIPHVNLRDNPIYCNCDLVHSLPSPRYAKSENYFGLNDSSVVCFSPKQWFGTPVLEYIEINSMDYTCLDWRLYGLIGGVCLLFTLIICSVGVYYMRWYIRYWMFLFKQTWRATFPRKRQTPSDDRYKYDAFVSYSNEDRNFVIRLVAMMENYEPYYRLCVFERDFNAGDVISETVLDCLTISRKTILILTDSFARSQWCQWELQMAQHKRFFFRKKEEDSLILIKLGEIMDAHMTPTLKYLMKTRIYLEWFSDPKRQKIFWQKLREALKHTSRGEVQV